MALDSVWPPPPPPRRVLIKRSRVDDPQRAAFIDLLLRDPAAAERERLEQRLEYWRRRLRYLTEHSREHSLRDLIAARDRLRALEAMLEAPNGV